MNAEIQDRNGNWIDIYEASIEDISGLQKRIQNAKRGPQNEN